MSTLDKATQYFKTGNLKQALKEYQAIIMADPQNALAFQGLGHTYCKLKRYDEAINAYHKALELDSGLAMSHMNLGVIYGERREFAKGEKEIRQAIELDPKLVQAHVNLGLILALQGRLTEGETALKQAIELDPKQVFPYCALVEIHLRQGHLHNARDVVSRALQVSPTLKTLFYVIFAITGAYSRIAFFFLLLAILVMLYVQPIIGLIAGLGLVALQGWESIKSFQLGARKQAAMIAGFALVLLWIIVSVFINTR